jgi:hypothetical protein
MPLKKFHIRSSRAHCDQCLQRRSTHNVGTAHHFYFVGAALCADNRIPIRRVFDRDRVCSWTQYDSWCWRRCDISPAWRCSGCSLLRCWRRRNLTLRMLSQMCEHGGPNAQQNEHEYHRHSYTRIPAIALWARRPLGRLGKVCAGGTFVSCTVICSLRERGACGEVSCSFPISVCCVLIALLLAIPTKCRHQ